METGAAITAAIDALDLSQLQNEAGFQALVATALVPYWDQGEVSSFVSGELSNYATSSSVTAISSALSSYDDSSQVDSKIITALLDFYTRTEVDQEIADALENVDLSNYYMQAETQTLYYPRTELDSLLTATLTQYWTSGRTQTEIDDAIAGADFLTQAQAEKQVWQAGLRGDGSVDQEGVVDLLTTCRLAVTLLLELKAPVVAVLPTLSCVMSAVVAFRVLAAASVTSLSRLMPPSAKLASSAPSSLRTVTSVLDLEISAALSGGTTGLETLGVARSGLEEFEVARSSWAPLARSSLEWLGGLRYIEL